MTEPTGTVSYAEFARMNLRVATIKAAERVPKTERLLRMDVDLGSETRQIVAGIGAQYAPEALVGTQVVVVTSLEPATIRGLRSDGMPRRKAAS
jgi:methionyl-tRNA synthetase